MFTPFNFLLLNRTLGSGGEGREEKPVSLSSFHFPPPLSSRMRERERERAVYTTDSLDGEESD